MQPSQHPTFQPWLGLDVALHNSILYTSIQVEEWVTAGNITGKSHQITRFHQNLDTPGVPKNVRPNVTWFVLSEDSFHVEAQGTINAVVL